MSVVAAPPRRMRRQRLPGSIRHRCIPFGIAGERWVIPGRLPLPASAGWTDETRARRRVCVAVLPARKKEATACRHGMRSETLFSGRGGCDAGEKPVVPLLPLTLAAGVALVKGVARSMKALQVNELANLPFAGGGAVDLREAGELLLSARGTLGSSDFAGTAFTLRDGLRNRALTI